MPVEVPAAAAAPAAAVAAPVEPAGAYAVPYGYDPSAHYDYDYTAAAAAAGDGAAGVVDAGMDAEAEDPEGADPLLANNDALRRLQGRRLRDAPVRVQEIRQEDQIDLTKPYMPAEEEERKLHMVRVGTRMPTLCEPLTDNDACAFSLSLSLSVCVPAGGPGGDEGVGAGQVQEPDHCAGHACGRQGARDPRAPRARHALSPRDTGQVWLLTTHRPMYSPPHGLGVDPAGVCVRLCA
jgi:hypothetical protein